MAATYTRYLADSRRSGFIRQRSNATGELVWKKPAAAEEEPSAEIRALLCPGNQVIVDGMNEIYAFDRSGIRQWKRSKFYGSPVAIQDDRIHFLNAGGKHCFDSVDLTNRVQYQRMPVPGMMARAHVTLFEPYKEGLVAQVQDQGVIEDSPPNFLVYNAPFQGLGFRWCTLFDAATSPIQPLVSWEHRRVITSPGSEVVVYDLDGTRREPEPLARFPFPLADPFPRVSCGDDGLLYWCGSGDKGLELVVTDMDGKEIWRWSSQGKAVAAVTWPIVGNGMLYILTASTLFAFKDGKLLWRYYPDKASFCHATALGDGSVLITDGPILHRTREDGSSAFVLDFEDMLVAPPIIDELGRIYVAGKETLYALD
ncbi:MAG TPA: PQQ-binding-like beta-propeller repeat protein [Candidatus Acidoferrum sp.]|nr:PQQ-binding-like beta-propeller repeat protein [Candidatus Acidoferrum sp.]